MRAIASCDVGHEGEAIGGAPRANRAGRLEGGADALRPGGVGPLRDLEADLDILAGILAAGADLLGQGRMTRRARIEPAMPAATKKL